MNLNLYEHMMSYKAPNQQPSEWLMFLETCSAYLDKHRIKDLVVVELGLFKGYQKVFYENLFQAEHIGININDKYCIPDIIGDTHDPETLIKLKEKLKGRPINILFIDASHCYEDVKKDFEIYSLLCTDIVAIHDIELGRYRNDNKSTTWKFWDELKEQAFTKLEGSERFTFLSICRRSFKRSEVGCLGIGVILKK